MGEKAGGKKRRGLLVSSITWKREGGKKRPGEKIILWCGIAKLEGESRVETKWRKEKGKSKNSVQTKKDVPRGRRGGRKEGAFNELLQETEESMEGRQLAK